MFIQHVSSPLFPLNLLVPPPSHQAGHKGRERGQVLQEHICSSLVRCGWQPVYWVSGGRSREEPGGGQVGQRWSLKLQRLAGIAASAPRKPHGSSNPPGLWSQADLGSNPEPAWLGCYKAENKLSVQWQGIARINHSGSLYGMSCSLFRPGLHRIQRHKKYLALNIK